MIEAATALLRSWEPPDPRQRTLRARFLTLTEQQPRAAERGCYPDHLTAGALVVAADRASVLLNLHARAGRWFAFGGHCEPGDRSLADTALREATEESGIEELRLDPVPVHLDIHEVGFCDPRGGVRHFDVRFAALAPAGAVPVLSAESHEVRWFPIAALPADLGGDMIELIDAALARLA